MELFLLVTIVCLLFINLKQAQKINNVLSENLSILKENYNLILENNELKMRGK